MSKIIDLKQLESIKEASVKGNAEEQLTKLQEHGVFYISTSSDVETIAAVERHVHQLNIQEFESMASASFATGNLTTVKHFVPRVNHLPFEHFTASEIGEKLNAQNSDEFSYITGIINAIIKDMFLSLNKVIEMNIDEKKSLMNKFHETLINRLDTSSS